MREFYICFAVSALLGCLLAVGADYAYENRSNKCTVSMGDAISSRSGMVELRRKCGA